MSVKIASVDSGSVCEGLVRPSDELLMINGVDILDVLDYMHMSRCENPTLTLRADTGTVHDIPIKKQPFDELGLTFESFIMDMQRGCSNRCVFCFVDQLPKNMRHTLYFKDDDARMSFLMGNYISMTNLSERDVERMIEYKISPINVSVHTTNPELRSRMLGNDRGGSSLSILKRLFAAGITINCQIVVCKGLNDREELSRTVTELYELGAESIAVVPVGLSKHREGLYPLVPLTKEDCRDVCARIYSLGSQIKRECGRRLVYVSDEFLIKAGLPMYDYEFYEEFAQLENGVGLLTMLKDEFEAALEHAKNPKKLRIYTAVTGIAAYPFIKEMYAQLEAKCPNIRVDLVAVENEFFGEEIDVAGLVTGGDIIEKLKGRKLFDKLIIPAAMLRYDRERFLDDVTVKALEKALKVKVLILENDGAMMIESLK